MTPEQLVARLEQQGDKLTARAVRDILRTFRDVDTRLLLAQILSAMQAQSPTQRLAAREQLLAIARSLYPSLPDSLTALTAQAASAGAHAGAGMVLQAAPFVQPAVLEVAGEAAARLRGFWGASAEDYAGRVGSILTRALSSGGRYPVTREIQNALSVSRQRAQLIAQNEIAAAAMGGQYRVAQKAAEELDAPVLVTWRSAGDRRVRASHRSLSGKTVKQGQSFKAGMTLRYPHDPAAPASETVRCRCHCTFSLDED